MVSPNDILNSKRPQQGFLCPPTANTYNIQFTSFRVRDPESKTVLFHISQDQDSTQMVGTMSMDPSDPEQRTVRYQFPTAFLDLSTVGTSLTFSVGDRPIPKLRLIERFYYKDKLIKSFDFEFGFVIPNSTNSWESIYVMPQLSKKEKQKMIEHPFETVSDTFYFVEDELIVHNKAYYSFQ
ncbi:hypothetical protein P9112_000533 [Eukaryota sp. TZLM1-RC]